MSAAMGMNVLLTLGLGMQLDLFVVVTCLSGRQSSSVVRPLVC